MAGTLKVTDDKLKVTFAYEALTTKVEPILEACSEYLWVEETDEEGVVTNPFADATNQEKLDVVDKHVKRVLLDMANTHKSTKAQKEAREAEAASEYVI